MRADTPIDNLYIAGQDAWTPAVAGAMYGGLLCSIKVSILFNIKGMFKKYGYEAADRSFDIKLISTYWLISLV